MATLTRFATAFPAPGSYQSWGSQLTGWSVVSLGATATHPVSPSSTFVALANADGTFTEIFGKNFTFDGSASHNATGGTVTKVLHVGADGTTSLEQITNLPSGYLLTQFEGSVGTDVGGTLSGNDTITGNNQFTDVLFGYGGNDTFNPGAIPGSPPASTPGPNFDIMVGAAGNDTFNTGSSNQANYIVAYNLEGGPNGVTVNLATHVATDTFGNTDTLNGILHVVATNKADTLTGGSGNDIFHPGGGTDSIDGGTGFNVLSYGYSSSLGTDGFSFATGITVNYTSATSGTVLDPSGSTDTFSNIQRVIGTRFADTFNGHAGTNEVFIGGAGNDIFHGNGDVGDHDMVDYSTEYLAGGLTGITANLAANNMQGGIAQDTVIDPFGNSDSIANVRDITGTNFDDKFFGGSHDNNFFGLGGNDQFRGNDGIDRFDGGLGLDTADYRFENGASGITVNLTSFTNGTVTDTFGKADTLVSIEQIDGTAHNDVFHGSTGSDRFAPGQGNDQITSGGGQDTIIYSIDPAATSGITYNGGLSSNQLTSAYFGTDTFSGFTSIDLFATQNNDSLTGTKGSDVLHPSMGTDTIDGGLGKDTLSYTDNITASAAGGVTFNASSATSGTVIDAGGSTDTYSNIEILAGSMKADIFNGSSGNDTFQGLAGNDTFHGGAGVNTLDYSVDQKVATFYGLTASGITIDLSAGTATDGIGNADTFDNIQNVTGTNLVDHITGSAAANVLNGLTGADFMTGLAGNDTYIVDNLGDQINEAAGSAGGVDTVESSNISLDLTKYANVERATLLGSSNLDVTADPAGTTPATLTGNTGANHLTGSGGNDSLTGGSGQDTLAGGGGNDTFIFKALLDSTLATPDHITDFQTGDKINVHALDALIGNHPFVVDALGDNSFATGHIKQTVLPSNDLVLDFNTNADTNSEMQIVLLSHPNPLSSSDFVL